MARYLCKVRTSTGTVAFDVNADSMAEAKLFAEKRGTYISATKYRMPDFSSGMKPDERYLWLRRMGVMMGSGISATVSSYKMSQYFSGRIKKASNNIRTMVDQGLTLTMAMELDRKNFPVATTALVKAGAQAGNTAHALIEAAIFEEDLQKSKKGANTEILKAIAAFILAAAVMIGTTEYFGPMILNLDMLKESKSVDVDWVITVGRWLSLSIGIMMIIGILMTLVSTIGKRIFPEPSDKLIMTIPIYRDVVLSRSNYVTLYGLSLLVSTGVAIADALDLTYKEAPKGGLKADLGRALKSMRSGKHWASDMKMLHPTDRAALLASIDKKETSQTLKLLSLQYRDLYFRRVNTMALVLNVIAMLYLAISQAILFGLTIVPMLQFASGGGQ